MPATKKPSPDALDAYRAKRSADRTPEPSGAVGGAGGRMFVVHKHAARRLHYDLRLEWGGTLKSWAVPRGPSRNPADKRLAVRVEDHPLEYGDFEGIIPEGNYGAGAVIVWDRGEWESIGDPEEGSKSGKLLFDLKGYKLKGRWTLVKIKREEKEWLLIKERDGHTSPNGDDYPPGSVLSGLTVEDLKEGKTPGGPIRERLERLKAPRRAVRAADIELMLAEPREKPFTREGWVFEAKLDGYRFIAGREGGEGRLISRGGHDFTAGFPEITRALAALPFEGIVLDGELVVPDEAGRPSFQRLQQRGLLTRPNEVRRAAVELPAVLYLFDLLAFDGFDLRPLPLVERKALLRDVLPGAGPLRYSEHFETRGEELYEQVVPLGLEGIVAKKAASPYRGGRSAEWLKIRADRSDDFVVVGFSAPKGARGGFGALHLGQYEEGTLVYAGRAGSGFDSKQLDEVRRKLDALARPDCPCTGPVPKGPGHTWVEPRLVAEVRFKERTNEGLLRQPVFLRFRDDKRPEECVKSVSGASSAGDPVPSIAPVASTKEPVAAIEAPTHAAPRTPVRLSNLTKIFWPDHGYTKGDLIEYYRAVSPWLLPYLRDRPVVMTRYPDGINGKSFFQKDAPQWSHDFVRTVTVWSEDSQRELNYFVIDDEQALLYVANMASIPLHVWASRVQSLEQPDWCVIDLDPKGAPFANVVKVARATKDLCDDIGLPTLVKTTGSSGLHVMIPLGRQVTFEQSRTLGGLLSRLVATDLPDIATVTRQISKRDGKVYLDYLQNGHGKLIVVPFSVRPVPGAWVSIPLKWSEVGPKLEIGKYTIKTAPARMKKLKDDPLRAVLDLKPDLPAALQRLHERIEPGARAR